MMNPKTKRYAIVERHWDGVCVYDYASSWGEANRKRKKYIHRFMGRTLNNIEMVRIETLKGWTQHDNPPSFIQRIWNKIKGRLGRR